MVCGRNEEVYSRSLVGRDVDRIWYLSWLFSFESSRIIGLNLRQLMWMSEFSIMFDMMKVMVNSIGATKQNGWLWMNQSWDITIPVIQKSSNSISHG